MMKMDMIFTGMNAQLTNEKPMEFKMEKTVANFQALLDSNQMEIDSSKLNVSEELLHENKNTFHEENPLLIEEILTILGYTEGTKQENGLENEGKVELTDTYVKDVEETAFPPDDGHINAESKTDEKENLEITMGDPIIYQQALQLIQEIAPLLREIVAEEQLKENAGRLFPILKRWYLFMDKGNEANLNHLVSQELTEKEAAVWKSLVQVFEKRMHFTDQNMYQSRADISKNDVVSWLQHAMNRYTSEKQINTTHVPTQNSIPVSEVQQYAIHLDSVNKVDKVSDELIQKFQHIIRESRFLQTGLNTQLSIMLQPENLGNMTVRFMQVDGDLTVKIIVASQVAKDMLESNIHQLKHMFAPHQVTIERDELMVNDKFVYKEGNEEERNQEQAEQHMNESNEQKQDQPDEEEFQTWLERLSKEALVDV